MKKLILLCLSLSALPILSFGQTFDHPIAYNNFIVEAMNAVSGKNLAYISQAVHSEDFKAIEAKRQEVLKQVQQASQQIAAATPYEKGQPLQTECLEVLKLYKGIFETEIAEANILKQGSQASFEAMEAYIKAQDKAEKNLAKAAERFTKAQKNYLKTHQLDEGKAEGTADENALQTVSEVNAYARSLYLIYFELSKYSTIFLEAVSNQDKAGIEGKRKRVEAAADRATAQLSKTADFKGDRDFLDKTLALTAFYKDMASGGFADISKVVRTEQSKLTQDDIDRYNTAIEKLNNESAKLINAFNQSQMELLRKHVPKGNVLDKNVKRT